MKKTRLISCILIMAMLLMSLPAVSFAATSVTITIKDGEPSKDSGDGWDWDGDTLYLDDEDLTFKISGTLKGDVELVAGTLSAGTVSGDLTVLDDGTVSGGTYNGNTTVDGGTISGGTFGGTKKSLTIEDGIVKGGTIKVTVKNEGGTISGGTFSGTLTNENVITGGTFSGAVTNEEDAKINAKKGTFKGAVKNYGLIENGTFSGTVTNGKDGDYEDAELDGGVYDSTVTNYAIITDGEFNGTVTNYATIDGGEFNKTVSLKSSKNCSLEVNGGLFAGINFGTTKFDEDDLGSKCEFKVTAVNKGTGIISVPKTAEYDETVKVGVTVPQRVTLDSISAVDGNGTKVKLTAKSDYYTFKMPANGVTVTAVFSDYNGKDADEDEEAEMDTIRVYIDEPEYDESLSKATVAGSNTPYSVKSTSWTVDEEEVKNSYTLDVGEEPAVTIVITAKTGYEFPSKPVVTLNGVKAEIEDNDEDTITIYHEYPAIKKSTHGHTYTGKYNSTQHWRECSGCDKQIDKENHTYGKDGKCTVCGAVKVVETIPFTDVKTTDYFYNAVKWAFNAKPQVTDGISATLFGPDRTCTRGQVVTFLWRAAGEPAPKTTVNPFTDVKASDYFYKPVLWAYENGITDGTSKDKFSPNNTCTNAHVLTYIWRAIGSPNKDANAANWYDDAYYWAKYNGIINGSFTGTYNLQASCPRSNVVFYLYQYNLIKNPNGSSTGNTTAGGTVSAAGVSADLKNFLDSYESFMNQYCAYFDGGKVDYTSSAYLNLLQQYVDMTNKADSWKKTASASSNPSDLKYFNEILNRVNEKLGKIKY